MRAVRLRLALSALCFLAAIAVGLRFVPDLGSRVLPYAGDTNARIDEMIEQAASPGGTSEPVRATLVKTLQATPLASEPLFAYSLLTGGGGGEALDEALRRNPRILSARLLKAQRHIENEEFEAAVEDIITLIGVDRARIKEYIGALVEISGAEEGQQALLAQLQTPRTWSPRLLEELNLGANNFNFLYVANQLVPDRQEGFLDRLIKEQRHDLALIAWLEFNDVALEDVRWPFNEGFDRLAISPPFNWTIENDRTELMDGGGLYLVHLAREETVFSRQYMTLGPGSYQLEADSQGQMSSGGGTVAFIVECVGADKPLASQPLGQIPGIEEAPPAIFIVPDNGCTFQVLKIVGDIGLFPRVSRLEVSRVQIESIPDVSGEG